MVMFGMEEGVSREKERGRIRRKAAVQEDQKEDMGGVGSLGGVDRALCISEECPRMGI